MTVHFTTAEPVAALGGSVPAARAALMRLEAKGEVADPHLGVHVIIPPGTAAWDVPADQFVPQLKHHLGEADCVTLLSTAELHGAAHQRPQSFQVMVKFNRRSLQCREVRVEFVTRKDLERTAILEKHTPRGPLHVASPEAAKRPDTNFTADMTPLLGSGQTWSFEAAYDRVWRDLLARLPREPWGGA